LGAAAAVVDDADEAAVSELASLAFAEAEFLADDAVCAFRPVVVFVATAPAAVTVGAAASSVDVTAMPVVAVCFADALAAVV
jgi:hypothetical protein